MDTINTIEEMNLIINKQEMLLVYFGNHACGVCEAMAPKIENLLERYPKVRAVRVETGDSPELSAKYNVFAVPVIILFVQGKETVREARIISVENLERRISRYYGMLYG